MSLQYRISPSGTLIEPLFSEKRSVASHILATSARVVNSSELCQYRKGFFDHLKPRAFITNTLRVVVQQSSLIMANLMTDQLENDIQRNKMVEEGKITPAEATTLGEEWEKEEWEKRWQGFPPKLFTAFVKYHFITLFMRSYEYLAALSYDEIVVDKLTMDPFYASRALVADRVAEKKSTSFSDNVSMANEMLYTTFWGNLIAFLSDYSVHQIILCYGYFRYYQRRKQQAENAKEGDSNATVPEGAILSSFLRKSSQLFVARSLGLVCTAIGGAIGTLWWPGWGTLLLSNMGESASGVIMDDGQTPSPKDKEE